MKNNKQNEGSGKQSNTPQQDVKRMPINDTQGYFKRAKFLSSFLAQHFEEMDEQGFSPSKDIPIVMEFYDRLYDSWMFFLEEDGLEIIYPNK